MPEFPIMSTHFSSLQMRMNGMMMMMRENMNNLSVLRIPIKQKSRKRIMKSNKIQSKEVSLTVDALVDVATNAWNKIRSSKLTIKVDPV